MKERKIEITYKEYGDISELGKDDAALLTTAREITGKAYAPYSRFRVGAAGRTVSGNIVTGTNQENASFPVGICAERSLLATAAALFPDQAIEAIAVSYDNEKGESLHPISPCGMCRQALQEYESRGGRPIRLILSGKGGEVLVIEGISSLLPFGFSGKELA